MRLLKRVDVQFTKKNVYDVLESYRSYVRMAGYHKEVHGYENPIIR